MFENVAMIVNVRCDDASLFVIQVIYEAQAVLLGSGTLSPVASLTRQLFSARYNSECYCTVVSM